MLSKAKSLCLVYCIAKNKPDRICRARQVPKIEPKFHKKEIFKGIGISTSEEFKIFMTGSNFKGLKRIGQEFSYYKNKVLIKLIGLFFEMCKEVRCNAFIWSKIIFFDKWECY